MNYEDYESGYLAQTGRFDDAASAFLARELTHVRAQVLQVKKAPLNAFQVFPVQTDIPVGAETALQRIYDSVGIAKIIGNYADDLPRADVAGKETAVRVYQLGAAYGYNVRELQNAAFANRPLSALKAAAARNAIDIKLNQLAWYGEAKNNIFGFLNQPNIGEYALKNDGANGSTALKDKDEATVIRDMNEFLQAIPTATNEVETPNTVLLPPEAYAYLKTTRLTDSDRTLMDFIQQAHPEITRWMKVGELKGAGEDGKDVMFAGVFDPTYIKFEIPARFNQLPVEKRNLEYVIDCLSETAGVTVNYPMAFIKAVGC